MRDWFKVRMGFGGRYIRERTESLYREIERRTNLLAVVGYVLANKRHQRDLDLDINLLP